MLAAMRGVCIQHGLADGEDDDTCASCGEALLDLDDRTTLEMVSSLHGNRRAHRFLSSLLVGVVVAVAVQITAGGAVLAPERLELYLGMAVFGCVVYALWTALVPRRLRRLEAALADPPTRSSPSGGGGAPGG